MTTEVTLKIVYSQLAEPSALCRVQDFALVAAVPVQYHMAVGPVLMYGLECTYQDKNAFKAIESFQGKLIKSALGLKKSCKTSPLLQAIGIVSIYIYMCIC
jgi:hypothetical protein